MEEYAIEYLGLTTQGYLRKTTHDATKQDKRKLVHRLVWEEYHKACLLSWSNVHHINHIKTDNRIENLEAMMNRYHPALHHTKDMSDRICFVCGTNKTSCDSKQRLVWRKHPITKQKWLCHKCYCTIQNKRRWQMGIRW
jgi:hypothetical protein